MTDTTYYPCRRCHGSGELETGAKYITCPRCNGSGATNKREYKCTLVEGYKRYIEAYSPREAAEIYLDWGGEYWRNDQEIFVEDVTDRAADEYPRWVFAIEVKYKIKGATNEE